MIKFKEIKPFNMSVKYTDSFPSEKTIDPDSHIHEECEIYINISGDVSFAVENNIYPVTPGNIIITRPYEYHHCIYHSNKQHKHFWILFSPNGNEEFLDVFYKRKVGEKNLLSLSPEKTDELITLCHKMAKQNNNSVENYLSFFRLINLLQSADAVKTDNNIYPADVIYAINYINNHFADTLSISDIAKGANVSINTLERHFHAIFNISPSSYIRKKRLANSAKLLIEGKTVTEASEQSGFPDYSAFIALFKKTYGVTPLKYKKKADL